MSSSVSTSFKDESPDLHRRSANPSIISTSETDTLTKCLDIFASVLEKLTFSLIAQRKRYKQHAILTSHVTASTWSGCSAQNDCRCSRGVTLALGALSYRLVQKVVRLLCCCFERQDSLYGTPRSGIAPRSDLFLCDPAHRR